MVIQHTLLISYFVMATDSLLERHADSLNSLLCLLILPTSVPRYENVVGTSIKFVIIQWFGDEL